MTAAIIELLALGATIFTQERQRHLESGLYLRLNAVDEAKSKRFPFFTDRGVRKAEKEVDNYLAGYTKEMRENVEQLKRGQNV